MIEITRRHSSRTEDSGPTKLDLIIMKNLSDALGTNMDRLNVINGRRGALNKFEAHEIIDETLTSIGYGRVWDASDNEKLLAASWVSLEFNLWNKRDFLQEPQEAAEARRLSSSKSSSACPNNSVLSPDCKPECHLLFPDGDIDNFVSMYGRINHLLKKYRNLSVCLARNRRTIAKELHKIPYIDGRVKSSLLFDCNFDEILNVLDAAEKKSVTQNTTSNRLSLKSEGMRRSSSSSAASVRDRSRTPNTKSADDSRTGQRSNTVEYTEQKRYQPTITRDLSDKILRELEAKQYRAKRVEIELLRSREAETAYLQSLLNSQGLQKLFLQKEITNKLEDDAIQENGSRNNETTDGLEFTSNSKSESSYELEDLFGNSLKGYDVMAGELEEAIGGIIKGGHLSKSEMMDIVETADRDWIEYQRENGIMTDSASLSSASSLISRREQILLKSDLSDPLFRSYQRLFSYPLHSRKDEYDHLRSQHREILKRTAAVCEPFSPFDFVFYD